MEDGSHELMLSGPAETGKSTVACAYLHHLLSTTPRARGVMLRKTRASLMQTVHETYKSVVARSNVRVRAYGGEDPQWYDYPHNGSRLYLGGMDNAQKILSGERDFIYVCQAEDLVLQEWETLTTRATGRAGATDRPQVFGDCNPGPPTHWILHRPALKIIESRHVDNPRLYHADGTPTEAGARTMAILDALTGVLRARLFEGRWVAAEGLVYSFDKGVHLIDPFPIPPEWPRHMAIDFGFTNPFVALWFCVDPDARVHLYRQHYRTKMLVSDHGELIKRVERWLDADGQPNPDRERVIVVVE
jgi:phage terminase large subunit